MIARTLAVVAAIIVAGCTAPGPTIPSGTAQVPVTLMKPDGAGPFPAIVMLHDCSGLGYNSSGAPGRWASRLVQRGYVVVMPDSFSPRGYPNGVCADGSRVSPFQRDPDAYAALEYLRGLPYVDGKRIGVMGGSHGGSTTIVAMGIPSAAAESSAAARRAGFAAGVALYPGCAGQRDPQAYRAVGPLLILAGELDDWTPAAPCVALAEGAAKVGQPVAIKVYPGAHHSFDSPFPLRRVPHALGGRGATIGGNAQAWTAAMSEVDAFFDQHLKR